MRTEDRFIVLMSGCSFLSAIFIGGLTIVLVLNEGLLSIVKNSLAGMKLAIGATCVQCLFIALVHWKYKPIGYYGKSQFKVFGVLKCMAVLTLASFIFHAIAVLFGAPFFESLAQTYHFAVLLTSQACLPFCIFLGPDLDAWLKVFVANGCDDVLEVVVYFTSVCSVFGAWFGAMPIPLDWDRPWQVWPISCVVGALMGYALALLICSIYIPRQYRAGHKFKFF